MSVRAEIGIRPPPGARHHGGRGGGQEQRRARGGVRSPRPASRRVRRGRGPHEVLQELGSRSSAAHPALRPESGNAAPPPGPDDPRRRAGGPAARVVGGLSGRPVRPVGGHRLSRRVHGRDRALSPVRAIRADGLSARQLSGGAGRCRELPDVTNFFQPALDRTWRSHPLSGVRRRDQRHAGAHAIGAPRAPRHSVPTAGAFSSWPTTVGSAMRRGRPRVSRTCWRPSSRPRRGTVWWRSTSITTASWPPGRWG